MVAPATVRAFAKIQPAEPAPHAPRVGGCVRFDHSQIDGGENALGAPEVAVRIRAAGRLGFAGRARGGANS